VSRAGEDPQIIAPRVADDRPRIIGRKSDDPIASPHRRQPRQPRGSEANLELRKRDIVDHAGDAARHGLSIGGAASIHHVDPPVGSTGIGCAHVADALALKAIGKPGDLEPLAGVPIEIDLGDRPDRPRLRP
jgi:hypothetical protein